MIYKIKFNEDYSGFESWEKLESKYAKPQDYCKDHGDNKFLFVQKKKKPYIVICHRNGNGWATHPWKDGAWINKHEPWRSMKNEADWIAAVKNFIPELNVTEKQKQTRNTDRENTENVNISSQPTSVKTEKQRKEKEETTSFADTIESLISPANLPAMPDFYGSDELKEIYNLSKDIFDNVRCNPAVNKYVVGYPILWFGDIEAYKKSSLKILTVGINPSDREFPNDTFSRFPAWNNLTLQNYFEALNEYFNTNYYDWFADLADSISLKEVWNCSFITNECQNTALHIDYHTPFATKPTWSKKALPDPIKQFLQNIRKDYFQKIIDFLNPDIIFIGNGQCHDWQQQTNIELLISKDFNLNSSQISSMIDNLTNADDEPHGNRRQLQCLKSPSGIFIISGQYRHRPFAVYTSQKLRPIMTAMKEYYFTNFKK